MLFEPIRPGDFRNPMQLQVPIRTRGSDGSFAVAWALLRTVRVAFASLDNPQRPMKTAIASQGSEKEFASASFATMRHVLYIRAQPERVSPDWRLADIFHNRVFNLTEAVLVQNVNRIVRLVAMENISVRETAAATYSVMLDDSGNTVTDDTGEYTVS